MRIRISEVTRHEDGAIDVSFRSPPGDAKARWVSGVRLPVAGESYDVELDVDEVADPKSNTRKVGVEVPSISSKGDLVILRVVIESVDDDGMGYFRLADDCLVMINTVGKLSIGDTVEIAVRQESVTVTPIGV